MLCVVIKGPSFQEAHQQITKALSYADLVELRIDYFIDLNIVQKLRDCFSIPMIFTIRSAKQGGGYVQSEEKRIADLHDLAELEPEYIDLENHLPSHIIAKVVSRYPKSKLILSYHNFTKTPENMEGIYQDMKKIPAYFYKIAVMAHHCLDALHILCWIKNKADPQLIVISMGIHGQINRILTRIMGIPITYASLEEEVTISGQLSAKMLIERYHYHTLHPHSKVYGLIGDPVDRSISDHTHNKFIEAHHLDAVYLKIQVKPSELPDFLHLAKQLPFYGLSVTMPLKEQILPFLDHIEEQALAIGAVNTLLFKEGMIFGHNTDGVGALQAIEKESLVQNKRVIIIGAGGAARAIAYEAQKRGAIVTIVNRDAEKAFQLAQRFTCTGQGLDAMTICCEQGYDILINCTPLPLPISHDDILPQTIVMDITTNPKKTLFLQHAMKKKCKIIFGYQMFVAQALGQFTLWYGENKSREYNSF